MSIKDILVHFDVDESAQPTIDFASSLAVGAGAHLTAAGIVIEYPPPAAGPSIGGAAISTIEALEGLTREHRHALERAGEKFIMGAPRGIQTEFALIQGYRGEACRDFARLARYFDLSVIGQGSPNEDRLHKRIISESLFGAGRPLFIVPFIHEGAVRLERAMVCWDGGVQAARALAAAMPLLARSESIEIVTIGLDREPDLKIAKHLSRHGIKVAVTTLPGAEEAGDAILSYAADTSADYIVMGAYGHWRLTEFVLGGTTRTILRSMTVPVFMAH